MLLSLLLVVGLMTGLWLVSLAKRDVSIVDPCWGLGFVAIAWSSVWQADVVEWVGWLLAGLVTVWGLRLSGYLFWRNYGQEEDRRYQKMREKHGDRFWWVSLFTVFLLQAGLIWLVSMPIQAGIFADRPPILWLVPIGIAAWLVGFYFEAVGDAQMARFKARPDSEGEVLDTGVWRYTRHPNYFGDFSVWWGHYLLAASVGAWWTLFSPLVMSFLLLKVSGVSLLEKDIGDRRPEYEAYKRRTNAFFPGPPSEE